MESILDGFYDFESSFYDWIDRGEKYEEIKEQICGRLSRLEETLTDEQKMMIKELALLNHRMEVEGEKASYKQGFKTGLALAMEAIKH